MKHLLGLFIVVAGTLTGCTTYIPPGAKADLQAFALGKLIEEVVAGWPRLLERYSKSG